MILEDFLSENTTGRTQTMMINTKVDSNYISIIKDKNVKVKETIGIKKGMQLTASNKTITLARHNSQEGSAYFGENSFAVIPIVPEL